MECGEQVSLYGFFTKAAKTMSVCTSPSLSPLPSLPFAVPLPLCKVAAPIGILPPPNLCPAVLYLGVSKQWCCWSRYMTLELPHSVHEHIGLQLCQVPVLQEFCFQNSPRASPAASAQTQEPDLPLAHRA